MHNKSHIHLDFLLERQNQQHTNQPFLILCKNNKFHQSFRRKNTDAGKVY